MDEIKALAKITVNENNYKQIFPTANTKNKEGIFYSNLIANKYLDDQQASHELYGSSPNDVRYKMLKHRLKKKLYNNLFFFDYSKHKLKKIHQKEQECLHLLHHAHLLFRLDEVNVVLNLISKIKNISKEFEYTNFIIDALELEMLCYSNRGDLNKFEASKRELDKYLFVKKHEREAVTLFHQQRIKIKKSIKSRKSNLITLAKDLDRLKNIWEKTKSFEAFNAYYKATILYHELTGDFSAIVDLTVESENLVRTGQVNNFRFDGTFNKYVLVYAHFRAKKLKKGLLYAAEFNSFFVEGTPNWFAYLENYVLLALHSSLYTLTENLLYKVFTNTAFYKLPAPAKERWTLYQAYFLLMSRMNGLREQKINPFLLSLPEYSKDKQGFNVAILILQFLHYLQTQESEALLYRIDSLKKYILSHLKDSFSLRSKTFLKLLILTVTEDYDSEKCRKKGQKLYQKLADTPTPGDAYAEIEIVPYEHLWEHILETLEKHY